MGLELLLGLWLGARSVMGSRASAGLVDGARSVCVWEAPPATISCMPPRGC